MVGFAGSDEAGCPLREPHLRALLRAGVKGGLLPQPGVGEPLVELAQRRGGQVGEQLGQISRMRTVNPPLRAGGSWG